jgi:hypothetical protein
MSGYDSTVDLSDGLPLRCWRCWYREGDRCYAPALGPEFDRPKPGLQYGPEIVPEVFYRCREGQWFQWKRALLERVFGGMKVTIASEKRIDKAEARKAVEVER